ncbi:MAG: beta strand repeat-containing protein, partial [Isosphaeraceae bacterium]
MNWAISSGGNWDVAGNWVNANDPTDHHVPDSSDTAVIGALGGGISITHSTGTDTVQSVTSGTNLILSGGTLGITGNLQMSSGVALTLEGGTLASATVTSGSTVALSNSGGTLASGVTFAAGSTLDGSQSPAGLEAYYNFDTGPNDVSGNGNNGTLSSNPPALTSAGYQGGAYQFTAANDNYITAPLNVSPTAMPQLTMGGWFDASNASSTIRGLLSEDDGGYDRTIDIDTRNGGVEWSAFSGYGVVSGAAVVPNQWVFVAVRYNQATQTMSLDVNGTITNASTDFDLSQTNTLTIGRNPNFDTPFDGKIDSVFVYNQYLTNAQLSAIQDSAYADVTGGLTLNGTAKLGAANGGLSASLDFNGSQTMSGAGSVVFGASAGNGLFAQGNNGGNPTTLTIGAGIAITGGSGTVSGDYSNDSVVLGGTIAATTSGEILTVNGGEGGAAPTSSNAGPFVDQGSLDLGRTELFTLPNYPGGGTGIVQTPNQSAPSVFNIPVNIADPTTVFTLINSAFGVSGDIVGSVEFQATGGLDYTVNLVEGQDIRDHNNGGYVNTIGQGALGGIYVGSAYYGGGQVRLDEQGFLLPSSFNSATLTHIILHGVGSGSAGEPFLAAATVATSNGQSQVNINSYVNVNLRTYTNGSDYPLGGSLVETGNAPMNVDGALTINGQGGLSVSTNSTLQVSGNLLGNTTNAAGFNPIGTVVLDSASGTGNPPQLLEAMSQDLGNVAAGFNQNFAYGTLQLTANTFVELVDNADNAPGGTPEALYVNDLIVPAGATLNLDGLHLYARTEQISGTLIVGGAVVSGEVYDDANGNGSLDSGESGLSGWTVELQNLSTSAFYATTTNTSGAYSLTGVAAGSYTLSEVVKPGYVQTAPASPGTYSLTVTSGQTVSGNNLGDYATATFSGVVFNDLNGNGTQENGEAGLSAWTVDLTNDATSVITQVTTDINGAYSFQGVGPGTFTIQAESPSGYVATTTPFVVTSANGMVASGYNLGEFQTVALTGEVFNDLNGNGSLDGGEPGLSDWTVDLNSSSQVTTTVYSGYTDLGNNILFSGNVLGTLTTPSIQFGAQTGFNWHPFGASSFG